MRRRLAEWSAVLESWRAGEIVGDNVPIFHASTPLDAGIGGADVDRGCLPLYAIVALGLDEAAEPVAAPSESP